MGLADLIKQDIGPNDVQKISQELGTDPGTTQKAVEAALPMMLGGMAHTAQQPGGEQAIHAFSSGGGLGGMLGGILGQHHDTVQNGVQQASGLDAGKAGKLLILLAPFVLRALAKHQQQAPATQAAPAQQGGGLGSVLQREAQNAMNGASPKVGGVLGKILGGLR